MKRAAKVTEEGENKCQRRDYDPEEEVEIELGDDSEDERDEYSDRVLVMAREIINSYESIDSTQARRLFATLLEFSPRRAKFCTRITEQFGVDFGVLFYPVERLQ